MFATHLDYIKDNHIFTPTLSEFEMYLDQKIQLPKSVVITIDDGWRSELLNVLGNNGDGSGLLVAQSLGHVIRLVTGLLDDLQYSVFGFLAGLGLAVNYVRNGGRRDIADISDLFERHHLVSSHKCFC